MVEYSNFEELEIEATAEIQNAAEQSETGIVLEELFNKPDKLLNGPVSRFSTK